MLRIVFAVFKYVLTHKELVSIIWSLHFMGYINAVCCETDVS
jgi:hypothetical protein